MVFRCSLASATVRHIDYLCSVLYCPAYDEKECVYESLRRVRAFSIFLPQYSRFSRSANRITAALAKVVALLECPLGRKSSAYHEILQGEYKCIE